MNLGIINRENDYKPIFSTNGFYMKIKINKKIQRVEIDTTNQDIWVDNKILCGYENLQNMDNQLLLEMIENYITVRLNKK